MNPTRCDWAACDRPAAQHEDSYWHCRRHLYEHRQMVAAEQREYDLARYGKPLTRSRPPAECGTRSGFNRHFRDSTDPCDPCRQAERDYQRQRQRRAS